MRGGTSGAANSQSIVAALAERFTNADETGSTVASADATTFFLRGTIRFPKCGPLPARDAEKLASHARAIVFVASRLRTNNPFDQAINLGDKCDVKAR